jgi:hypothetical protein
MSHSSRQSPVSRIGRALRMALVAGAVAAAGLTTAMVAPAAAQPGPPVRDDLVAKIVGKKIHLDKTTGKVREITLEEARDLIASIVALVDPSGEDLTTVARADGAQMVALDGHLGHVVISRYNPDGSVSVRCVATADEAADFLAEEPLEIQ